VVSAGALGPLGRNGLYCRDIDVDRFPALPGWRGLNDSAVREYFDGKLYAFEPGWGPLEEMMQNLGLDYEVVWLGTQAAQTIKLRLQSGVPTLFCLWSPHPLNAQFRLSRIELPAYTTRALFQQGRSDFQTDVLEKVAAKNLAEISPDLEILYARFTVETATQERLMLAIDSGRQTVMQVCSLGSTASGREQSPKACLHAFEPAGGVRLGDDRGKHGRLAIVASERSKHSVCVLRRG
jgi:hypothetical protein